MKKTIAIIYGGKSSEHEISLMSALNICKALDQDKYNMILIGITKSGKWFFQKDIVTKERSLIIVEEQENLVSIVPGEGFFLKGRNLNIDFVFPILHGAYGEDGTIQGLFEIMNIAYAGSGVLGSSLGMDKVLAKRVWRQAGIPVLDDVVFEYDFDLEKAIEAVEMKFAYPVFVKPSNAGSSVGTSKAIDGESLRKSLKEARKHDYKVLVEPFLRVRELECSVVGGLGAYQVYGPGEILPAYDFYDYDSKYNDPDGASFKLEAELSEKDMNFIKQTAIDAFVAVCAEGYSRVDFFMDKDNGKIYLNEINTIPGFTAISMFPKMCEHGGLKNTELISKLIELGIEQLKIKVN